MRDFKRFVKLRIRKALAGPQADFCCITGWIEQNYGWFSVDPKNSAKRKSCRTAVPTSHIPTVTLSVRVGVTSVLLGL